MKIGLTELSYFQSRSAISRVSLDTLPNTGGGSSYKSLKGENIDIDNDGNGVAASADDDDDGDDGGMCCGCGDADWFMLVWW